MPISTFKATAHLQPGMVVKAQSRHFEMIVDEPPSLGGTDTGMNPVELLLCALGACQAIVARVYAPQFEIDLQDFRMELEGDLDIDGFLDKADVRCGFSQVRYNIHIQSDAPREKIEEFVAFISKKCPVGDTISDPVHLVLNEIVVQS
jgi:uncharacterized OsmC-like protein